MLLNLLSQSNYGRYNLKIAQLTGLECAIYLEELLDINDKAIRKEKIREETLDVPKEGLPEKDIYFIVDREYIHSRTTITVAKQKDLDKKLIALEILKIGNDDDTELCIDVFALAALMDGDPKKLRKVAKTVAQNKALPTKAEAILTNVKKSIKFEPEELQEAYLNWIDAVSVKGAISTASVRAHKDVVDRYSNHYLDVALEVLQIATIHGWRSPSYAINEFKRIHNFDLNSEVYEPSQQTIKF